MRLWLRRSLTGLLALAAVAPLAGCGNKTDRVTLAETEGIYVDVGELKYQVQISRQLNPSDSEDRAYLSGLAPEDRELASNEVWFGVFMLVQNETDEYQPAAREFEVHDTLEKVYRPVELASINPFAYRPIDIPPDEQIPVSDSAAAEGPIQGSLVLFKMTAESVDNRPLELVIRNPESPQETAIVDLDV
jgi:hypothetical protein